MTNFNKITSIDQLLTNLCFYYILLISYNPSIIMKNILNILQIVFSILLVVVILLQNRGSGLGAAFGGEGNIYRTKRGLEKSLHVTTIILSVLFLATALTIFLT